jgi:hypothetical protein
MGLIDKDSILAANDLKSIDVEVPEWGGSVRVKEMTAAEVVDFWEECRDDAGKIVAARIQPALLRRALVNEAGERMFDAETVAGLMKKSMVVISRLFAEAQKVNGMGAPEEQVKNFEGTTSAA